MKPHKTVHKYSVPTNISVLARYFAPIFLPVLIAGAIFSLAGCSRDVDAGALAESAETVKVMVQEINREKRMLPIRTSGRLASKAEIKLSFKIGGLVDQLYADEGQRVRQGTRLARLNLAEIDAQVLQAQSGLDKAQRDLSRAEGLYADSVATLEQVQDARTGMEIAEANLKIAAFNRTHAEIIAPVGGRVLKRTVEAGEVVGPGHPIFLFGADREGWVVRTGLADKDIVKLAVGDSAKLMFDAYPNQVFKGWVTELGDAADPISSTFEVEIAIDDPGGLLKSGFIARVDLYPSNADAFYFLPVEALVEGNREEGMIYVYDEMEGRARKVPVHIAEILDREIAISDSLEGYSKVITEGAGFLRGDEQVAVVTSPALSNTEGSE